MSIGNHKQIFWTHHSREKMRFYRLSEGRVRRVINAPKRTESGIAPNTVAVMQSAGSQKHPYEIWVMFQKIIQNSKIKSQNLRIISAWRYPGQTKPGQPLPEKILKEISDSLKINE